jgi:hypothetical protein
VVEVPDCVFGCLDLACEYGCQLVFNDVIITVRELVASLVGIDAGAQGPDL